MTKLAETYLKYGVPSNLASKYDNLKLSVSAFRVQSISNLKKIYKIDSSEAKIVKSYLERKPIETSILHELLENNNFTCCCCKGVKSDAYIIHHIIKYEISQDNSYSNLAVLCPNDHDLAHRTVGLVSGISPDQVKAAKTSWEQFTKIHRLAAAIPGNSNTFYLTIPRYQIMFDEIENLKKTIKEKEELVVLSSLIACELKNYKDRLDVLQNEKKSLETQAEVLIDKLSKLQFEEISDRQNLSAAKFLSGDLAGAIETLDEKNIDLEEEKFLLVQEKAFNGLLKNINDRIFRSTLLLLDGNTREACISAGKTLEKCEELSDKLPDLLPRLVDCYEEVGTIYFNSSIIDKAEAVFQNGLNLAWSLQEQDIQSVVPFIPDFLHNLGTIYYSRNELPTAREYLENSLKWYKNLFDVYQKIPNLKNNHFGKKLIANFTNLGVTYNALGLKKEAAESFENAEKLLADEVSEEDSEAMLKVRLISGKANMLLSSGQAKDAIEPFSKAIDLLNSLSKKFPRVYAAQLVETSLELCAAMSIEDPISEKTGKTCLETLRVARQFFNEAPRSDRGLLVYALIYYSFYLLNSGNKDQRCISAALEAKTILGEMKTEEIEIDLDSSLKILLETLKL